MRADVHILLDYRPALRQRTGVGHYVHELGAALARLAAPGVSVTLFSSSWKDRLNTGVPAGTRVVDRRVPVRLLNLAWHRFAFPPVELLAGRADVVQAAHPLIIPARHAVQAITVHDLDFLDHPERARAEIRRDYAALAPDHARRADLVVAVSQHTAAQVRARLDVAADRIAICRSGAPPWHARPAPAAVGPILFVGTIEPRKNVPGLLRAYERLLARMPSAPPLILAGKAVETSAPVLAAIQRAPLAGRVRHLGYVSDAERQRLYAEASMLVLPSFDEGFGLPALEAMTVGVPVIAARRGALPEVVGDAGTLVNPESDEEIANAIEALLRDAGRRQRHAAMGTARARTFSWVDSAAGLVSAYREALARRRGRRA